MYSEHQPQLAQLAQASPEGLERIITFALCTIRQPLRIACADYALVRTGNTNSLFGAKHSGLAYTQAQAPYLWEDCQDAYHLLDDKDAENVILNILSRVPCLGPAKAGFVCQMAYGLSGCLDTHNLTRFNLGARPFRMDKTKGSWTRCREILRTYNTVCRKLGGTRALWDGWCTFLAERDPVNYPSAERVSELHLAPLYL